jgi:hypothetical protein
MLNMIHMSLPNLPFNSMIQFIGVEIPTHKYDLVSIRLYNRNLSSYR